MAAHCWTRAITEPVTYTYQGLRANLGDAGPPLTPNKRRADARVRRALVDAWVDPERAQRDLLAAGAVYARTRDSQGLANAYMAHAQTHVSRAHMARPRVGPVLSLPATRTAKREYSFAADIYTHLLEARNIGEYSVSRQKAVHTATKGQRMRPMPLFLEAVDARAAALGGGLL